jgi:protein involved in sex pheromone biosynthesis
MGMFCRSLLVLLVFVTISLRNFVGERIKRKSNTMAKGRRTSNTMAKRRRTSNDLQNIPIKLKIEYQGPH